MARRKLPKNFDAKIKQQLLEYSASKQELQNQMKELVEEHQNNAQAVAAVKRQYTSIRKSQASQATQFARQATAPNTSFEQRQAALAQFENVSTFATSPQQQRVAGIYAKIARANVLQRQIRAGNLTDPFRMERIQEFEGVSQYASEIGNVQVQEVRRKLSENAFRNRVRRAELIQDPGMRSIEIRSAMLENEGVLDPGNRFMVDAEKKIRQSQKQYADARDRSTASQMRGIIEANAATPSQRLDLLGQMRETQQGDKTLKEIERLTREQNKLIQKDVQNFEQAQKNFPIATALMGGGGGGPGQPPGQMTDAQLGRVQRFSRFAAGVRDGAVQGAITVNEFMRSGVRAEETTFLNVADAQAMRAQQNMALLSDMSGRGLIRSFGDILLNTNESRFTGAGGIQRARDAARGFVEETRGQELRDALLGGGLGILGGVGTAAAGALTGNLALAGVGAGAALVGAQSLFGNRSVQATGIFDFLDNGRRRARAESSFQLEREQSAQRLTDADINRNLFRQRSFEEAIRLRETEIGAVTALGGDATSFRGAVAQRFRRSRVGGPDILRDTGVISFEDDIAAAAGRQRSLLDAAAGLGLDVNQLTNLTTGVGLATDSRFRGNRTNQAMRLRELEISGRGSAQQLMGNIQALNRLSGGADPGKQLESIFARGVASGFKNARLSQEFAAAVMDGMSRTRSADQESVGRQVTAMANVLGGGERGLQFAGGAFSDMSQLGQNRMVRDLSRVAIMQNTGAIGSMRIRAGVTDAMMGMDLPQQLEALNQIEQVLQGNMDRNQLDPEVRAVYAGLTSDGSKKDQLGMVSSIRERLSDVATGGMSEEFAADFRRRISEIRKEGGRLETGDVFDAAQQAAQETGVAGLRGATALTNMMTLLPFIQDEEVSSLLKQNVKAESKDQRALSRFSDLNRLREREIRARNALAGGGESRFTQTVLSGLTRGQTPTSAIGSELRFDAATGQVGLSQNISITELAKRRGMDLQSMGDLGTGIPQDRLNQMLRSRETSREIMTAATQLTATGEVAKGTDKDVAEVARAIANQSRLDIMDVAEGKRLGIDQVSMVSILPSSTVAIGEQVARALGREGARTIGKPGTGN